MINEIDGPLKCSMRTHLLLSPLPPFQRSAGPWAVLHSLPSTSEFTASLDRQENYYRQDTEAVLVLRKLRGREKSMLCSKLPIGKEQGVLRTRLVDPFPTLMFGRYGCIWSMCSFPRGAPSSVHAIAGIGLETRRSPWDWQRWDWRWLSAASLPFVHSWHTDWAPKR